MQELKKLTGHENVYLVERGNKAIFLVLKFLREKYDTIIIPDQGGWLTYSQFGKKLKYKIHILKTDAGVVDPTSLIENAVFIYSNPAGYFAEQPIKDIYEKCSKINTKVILDITGCIGSDFYHGNFADFTVCSFGSGKPVNLGHGGMLTSNEELKVDEIILDGLDEKLSKLEERYQLFQKHCKLIKEQPFHFIHKDKTGINVIAKFNNEDEKNKIVLFCEKNKYELVVCPKSIRVNENAISIEVKRL